MPAFEHENLAADQRRQVFRPVAKGRQRRGGRQANAHRRDRRQPLPLHRGVDKMRRADDDAVDRATGNVGMRRQFAKRGNDAGRYVCGGGGLDGINDTALFQQDRVGIGAADIDTDPPHRRSTPVAQAERTVRTRNQ